MWLVINTDCIQQIHQSAMRSINPINLILEPDSQPSVPLLMLCQVLRYLHTVKPTVLVESIIVLFRKYQTEVINDEQHVTNDKQYQQSKDGSIILAYIFVVMIMLPNATGGLYALI